MRVLEELSVARSETAANEDALVVTADYAAVIDGAGDPQGRTWRGLSFGQHASETLGTALRRLPPDIEPADLVAVLTNALVGLRDKMSREGLEPPWPAANLVLYSNAHRQILRVGDCAFRVDGQVSNPPPKAFEQTLINVRRLVLHAGLAAGLDHKELIEDVQHVFRTLYRYQELCQNTPKAHPYSFAVLDGSPVPPWALEVVDVPPDAREIVLASDGYPELHRSLAESEEALSRLLVTDPLLLNDHPQTKSPGPKDRSYDDRTYVRLVLAADGAGTGPDGS